MYNTHIKLILEFNLLNKLLLSLKTNQFWFFMLNRQPKKNIILNYSKK